MQIRYPISANYFYKGVECKLTQLFGENVNRLFYGPLGHQGMDFRTTGAYKYRRTNKGWKQVAKTKQERLGRIPIVAAHAGVCTVVLHPDKDRRGWGLYVTADPVMGEQYRTLYWHIETPWRSLATYKGVVKAIYQLIAAFKGRKVRRGAIIAIGGNNGLSTGPHLHFELQKRTTTSKGWSDWMRIDPMPYFNHADAVLEYNGRRWKDGEKI